MAARGRDRPCCPGQGCALPTRTYVHDDVYDEVVDRVLALLAALTVGDPLDPATVVGPVVSEAAMERILGVIDRAAADGATLLAGGARLGGDLADGWFVAPTVFGDVDHDSDLARNEVFGPVQALLRFSDRGRGAGPGQRQPLRAGRLRAHGRPRTGSSASSTGLEAGMVMVNGCGALSPGHAVRRRQAERLRARGRPGRLDEMVQTKTVLVDPVR